jgi:antitoxin MazE
LLDSWGLDYFIAGNYIVVMRARIVRIGNSQGIRIPKLILEQTSLKDEVELRVQDHEIVITRAQKPRAGWETVFRQIAKSGSDQLLDAPLLSSTRWDKEEWEW